MTVESDSDSESDNEPQIRWKSLAKQGFPNYIISTEGQIYNKEKQWYLSPTTNDVYPFVSLSNEDHRSKKRVHRLVAIAFLPNPENKPTVDHINRDKHDFRLVNLRWATSSEQAKNRKVHPIKRGRAIMQLDLHNKIINVFASATEASVKTNIGSSNISHACTSSCFTAGGYKWVYNDLIINMEGEIWKDITYLGIVNLAVSNYGRVKHLHNNSEVLQFETPDGYMYVNARQYGKSKTIKVHKLVMLAFEGDPPPGKEEINHIEQPKSNNCYSNLEYVSPSENMQHANNNNLISKEKTSKIVIQQDREFNFIAEYCSIVEASKATGLNIQTIRKYARINDTEHNTPLSSKYVWTFSY